MVKRECEICGFVGHGYEQTAHFKVAHVGYIYVTVVKVDRENKKATLQFEDGTKVEVPFTPPKGKMVKLEVYGEWRCNF